MNINIATKKLASTFGVLVGLAGIQHGIFEILQGNIATSELMIDAIGPEQRFWEYGTETALTIVPNYLITGILAIIFGLLVTMWAWLFIEKKYGARIFGLLSLILWLVGGGFAPIFMALFGFGAASKINSSLNWWRRNLPITLVHFLSKLWPWSLIAYLFVFVFGVEIAVFGYPLLWVFNTNATYAIQWNLAIIMLIMLPISIITAFAYDITKKI